MLEPTVIADAAALAGFVGHAWGLRVSAIAAIDAGTANCRVIDTEAGRYFLKEFQSGVRRDQVDRESAILAHLQRDAVAVGRIIATPKGEPSVLHLGRVFQLQSFIAGSRYRKFEAPDWLKRELPSCLSSIVRSLRSFPRLPNGYGDWFARDLPARARYFEEFAERAKRVPWLPPDARTRLAESAARRVAAIRAVAEWKLSQIPFTVGNTHGDYSVLQVIGAGSAIRAVVDFARASSLPLAWELARSFSYLDEGSRDGGIDPIALRAHVRVFEETIPLSDADKAHMLDLYAYQLAPSTMGFRAVLENDTPDQAALIDFACWRTEMCRTLIARRRELSAVLRG
jgi:Ser/Thr protein kinase RdoA (MazF antagonist)